MTGGHSVSHRKNAAGWYLIKSMDPCDVCSVHGENFEQTRPLPVFNHQETK